MSEQMLLNNWGFEPSSSKKIKKWSGGPVVVSTLLNIMAWFYRIDEWRHSGTLMPKKVSVQRNLLKNFWDFQIIKMIDFLANCWTVTRNYY